MNKIYKILKKAKRIALFSHENPDPDTIGSALALKEILQNIGKEVALFCESEIADKYLFLTSAENFNLTSFDDSFDLLVAVDIASSSMLGKFESKFLNHKNTLKIDHHKTGTNFAVQNYVKYESACAIVVFELAKKLRAKITPTIATSLYFAICGDTGLFRNNNTDSKTFYISGKLLEAGAEIRRVYSEFFDKKTVPYIMLTSNALLNAQLNNKLKYAIMTVSDDDYKQFKLDNEESIGNLPNTYLNCGYKIAAILKECDGVIRCSFRSKFEYDVSQIAETFGGGGHKNAAGCTINASLAVAKKQVKKAIENYLLGVENVN